MAVFRVHPLSGCDRRRWVRLAERNGLHWVLKQAFGKVTGIVLWRGSSAWEGPPVEHRFDAGRLDQGQLRLPVARGKVGIGSRLRLGLGLRL